MVEVDGEKALLVREGPLPPEGESTRIEHWRVAQSQARIVAANMADRSLACDSAPFFWTYHYGKNFEYIEHAER